MEVYADVVFLVNFFMDFIIFFVVSKLIKRQVHILRLIAGAGIMALTYCLLIFMLPLRTYMNIFAAILILMLGVTVTFQPANLKEFVRILIIAHISAFSVGGMGMAFFYYSNAADIFGNMLGFTIRSFSFSMLIVTSCSFYILFKQCNSWLKRVLIKKQTFYPIKIFLKDNQCEINALVDTGNSLQDPLSKAPVIITELSALKEFFSSQLYEVLDSDEALDILKISTAAEEGFSHRIRMLPFESLGKQNGILLGFRPDKVEITGEKSTITAHNVVIGLYNFKLSKDNAYQGLINPELINE